MGGRKVVRPFSFISVPSPRHNGKEEKKESSPLIFEENVEKKGSSRRRTKKEGEGGDYSLRRRKAPSVTSCQRAGQVKGGGEGEGGRKWRAPLPSKRE